MGGDKIILGLIGFPLGHSFSADYFNKKFSIAGESGKEYRLFPLQSVKEYPNLLAKYPCLSGLNVTIPYKETIIPYLTELDETAQVIGAVNTIRIIRKNGMIVTKGFNTDAAGFFQTLTKDIPEGRALILGTGGASKAVAHALHQRNTGFNFVSRNNRGPGIISYDDLTSDLIREHRFIINATPLGMYPATDQYPPIPYQYLTAGHFLYDLIYNPAETQFLKRGKAMHARTMSGMQMLINQAELSGKIFAAIT